jgi:ABC-2 type transport system permease protein
VKALLRQVRWEQRQFFRNVPAAVFTVAFPLIFLVLLSALFKDDRVDNLPGNPKFVQLFVPSIVAYGVISACYTGLAFTLTMRREEGILKRKRGTPLRLRDYIGGMIGSSLVVSALLSVVTIAIGILVFGITFPHWVERLPALVVVLLLGATCASAWGIAISALIPNQESAPAIINVLLFPLLFISGTFARVTPDSFVDHLAQVFPVWHFNRSIEWVFSEQATGGAWRPRYLLALAAWSVAGIVVSVLRFRWEPNAAERPSARSRRRRSAAVKPGSP